MSPFLLNKKIKKIGLLHALSAKKKFNSLYVVEDFKSEIKKTKIFNNFLENEPSVFFFSKLFIVKFSFKNKQKNKITEVPISIELFTKFLFLKNFFL